MRAWCEFRVVANTDMPQPQAVLCFNGNLIVSGGFSEALTPLHTSAISKAAVQETGAQSKTVTTVEEHAGETRGWLMWFRTWNPPLPSNYSSQRLKWPYHSSLLNRNAASCLSTLQGELTPALHHTNFARCVAGLVSQGTRTWCL